MVLYTGHVTAGGSVCVEALTQTGTAGGWRRTFTVEGVVTTVLINMIDVEPVRITTGHRQQRPPPPPPPPPSARGARDLTARPPARCHGRWWCARRQGRAVRRPLRPLRRPF
jgi:hypothetical protein